MSRARIGITAAIALLMGAGFALAQSSGGGAGGGSAGGSAGGASSGGAAGNAGGTAGTGTAGTGSASPGTGTNASGTGTATSGNPGLRTNSGGVPGADANVVPGGQHSSSGGMSTQPNGTSGAGAATGSSGTYSRQSTGGGAESMSAKERSEIRSAVDKLHVAVVRPSFMVVTGFAVPNSLTLHPLPTEVTDIVPAYENYKFFRTSKTVVIVDPDTRQIVEIVG